MRTVALLSMMVCLAACFPSGDDLRGGTKAAGGATGTGGSTAGATGNGGAGGAAAGGASGAGGGYPSGTVTYTNDVKPIFMVKCAPCHTTGSLGGHNLGATYANATQPATNTSACYGLNKGQCTIIRIKAGTMPARSPKCSGVPAMDLSNPGCLTRSEQDTVQAWIDGGLKE
jgi:hypothetical protein